MDTESDRGLLPAGGATRVRSFDRGGAVCRNRPIDELAFHDPLHDAEHEFWMAWTIDNSECAVEKCVYQSARCFAESRLRWSNDNNRWRCIKAAQQLHDARASGFAAANGAVVERQRKVHHCEVHGDAANHV